LLICVDTRVNRENFRKNHIIIDFALLAPVDDVKWTWIRIKNCKLKFIFNLKLKFDLIGLYLTG